MEYTTPAIAVREPNPLGEGERKTANRSGIPGTSTLQVRGPHQPPSGPNHVFAASGRLPSPFLFAALREQEKGKEAMPPALQDGAPHTQQKPVQNDSSF
jgi:hypothetical protein